ncbi:MAG: dienelactone hydrolase family protein [Chloroflexota bacterium]
MTRNTTCSGERHEKTEREAAFYIYPGTGHWFCEEDRPEYNPETASLAWQRTIEFLHTHL